MNSHKHKIKKLNYLCPCALQLELPNLFKSKPKVSLDDWCDGIETYKTTIIKMVNQIKDNTKKSSRVDTLAQLPELCFYFRYEQHQMPIIQWNFDTLIEHIKTDIDKLLPPKEQEFEPFNPKISESFQPKTSEPVNETLNELLKSINRKKNSGRFWQAAVLNAPIKTSQPHVFDPYVETIAEHMVREFWDSAPIEFLNKFGNKPYRARVVQIEVEQANLLPTMNENSNQSEKEQILEHKQRQQQLREQIKLSYRRWTSKDSTTKALSAQGICLRVELPCYLHQPYNLVVDCFFKLEAQYYIESALAKIPAVFKKIALFIANKLSLSENIPHKTQLNYLIRQFKPLLDDKFAPKLINELTPFANQYYPGYYFELLEEMLNIAKRPQLDLAKVFFVLKFCHDDIRKLGEEPKQGEPDKTYKQNNIWTTLLGFDINDYHFDEIAVALSSTLTVYTLKSKNEQSKALQRIKTIAKHRFVRNIKSLLLLRTIAINLNEELNNTVFKLCDAIIDYHGSQPFSTKLSEALFTLYNNCIPALTQIDTKATIEIQTKQQLRLDEEKLQNSTSIKVINEFLCEQLQGKDLAAAYDNIQPICRHFDNLIRQSHILSWVDIDSYRKLAMPIIAKLNELDSALSYEAKPLREIIKQTDRFSRCLGTNRHSGVFLGQKEYIVNYLCQYDKSLVDNLKLWLDTPTQNIPTYKMQQELDNWLANPSTKAPPIVQLIIDLAQHLFTDRINEYKVTAEQLKKFALHIDTLDSDDYLLLDTIKIKAIRALHNELQTQGYDINLWNRGRMALKALMIELTEPEQLTNLEDILNLLSDSFTLKPWLLDIEGIWIKWIEDCLTVDSDNLYRCQQSFGNLLLTGTQEAKNKSKTNLLNKWKNMLAEHQDVCV